MKDVIKTERKEVFWVYLNCYSVDIRIELLRNLLYIPDEQSIIKSIQRTEDRYKHILPEIVLSDKEKDIVIKQIKSVYPVI